MQTNHQHDAAVEAFNAETTSTNLTAIMDCGSARFRVTFDFDTDEDFPSVTDYSADYAFLDGTEPRTFEELMVLICAHLLEERRLARQVFASNRHRFF